MMDPLTQFYTMLGICALIGGAAFTLGRMSQKEKDSPKDSGSKREAQQLQERHEHEMRVDKLADEMRSGFQEMRDRLTRIESGSSGHPTWIDLRKVEDEARKEREVFRLKIAALEATVQARRVGDYNNLPNS